MTSHLHAEDPVFRPAGQLRGRSISWLVPRRFALGQLALIDGDPDLGKSCIMLDLAARLSTGRGWPDGNAPMQPAAAIYLSAEDGAEDTVVPRLQAAGADLNRVFVACSNDPLHQRRLTFPSDINVLDRALALTGARLVVIDPIIAFLDRNISSASDESIRRALYALARLAQTRNCLIILIRHLNKRLGLRALYRGGGSIGFAAHCRSAWLVGAAPGNQSGGARGEGRGSQAEGSPLGPRLLPLAPGPSPLDVKRCVLAQGKNNNAGRQPSLLYELVPHASGYPVVRWLGTCSWSAEDLVARPSRRTTAGARRRARDFLKEFLRDGPRRTQEIWDAAFELDFSERTLSRARKDAKIESRVVWAAGIYCCYWLLPGHKLPPLDVLRTQIDGLMQQSPLDQIDEFWAGMSSYENSPVVAATERNDTRTGKVEDTAEKSCLNVVAASAVAADPAPTASVRSSEPGVAPAKCLDADLPALETSAAAPANEAPVILEPATPAVPETPAVPASCGREAERAKRRALGLWVA